MNKLLLLVMCTVLMYCAPRSNNEIKTETELVDVNLPGDGFNVAGSSTEAVMIADKVMLAMGGRKAWDDTRYIQWTFFDKRVLLWDKHSGDVRIDYKDRDLTISVNTNTLKGKAYQNGAEITNADSLASYLKKGKSTWINDSYWLVMPFKMKDSGVTLDFIGEDTVAGGRSAHFLQMSFDNVGDTPDNMYHVWVDQESYLVVQWAYFANKNDPHSAFTNAWSDYQKYGSILLSGNRSPIGNLSQIKVLDTVPDGIFEDFTSMKL